MGVKQHERDRCCTSRSSFFLFFFARNDIGDMCYIMLRTRIFDVEPKTVEKSLKDLNFKSIVESCVVSVCTYGVCNGRDGVVVIKTL